MTLARDPMEILRPRSDSACVIGISFEHGEIEFTALNVAL
jgi:hypothetical protein